MEEQLEFIYKNNIINGKVYSLMSLDLFKSEFVYNINNHKYNIIKSSRQIGMSTLFKSYASWCLMNGFDVLYISHSSRLNKLFIEDVISIIDFNAGGGLCKLKNDVLIFNGNKLEGACSDKKLISRSFNNTIMIIDNGDNLKFLERLIGNHSHRFNKIIINGNNTSNKTKFYDKLFEYEEYNYWNRFKLHYSLSSRTKLAASALKVIMGERFNIEYELD